MLTVLGDFTCIVDQDVDALEPLLDPVGKVPHRLQAGQVEDLHLHFVVFRLEDDLVGGRLGALEVAASHDHVGASLGKVKGRLVADAAVGAGDDGDLAVQAFL